MLVVMNSVMFILFLRLFTFFLNYRQSHSVSRIKNDDKTPKLKFFNKFVIGWVYFLCALCLWNLGSLLVDGLAKLYYGVEYGYSPVLVYYLSPVYKILIPFKDLLIALSFASLYYYQGMKERRAAKDGSEGYEEVMGKIQSERSISYLMDGGRETLNNSQ
jgi:hypothetical protein